MRWIAAVLLAVVLTFVVSAASFPVGIYEILLVFLLAMVLSWFLVVRRTRK